IAEVQSLRDQSAGCAQDTTANAGATAQLAAVPPAGGAEIATPLVGDDTGAVAIGAAVAAATGADHALAEVLAQAEPAPDPVAGIAALAHLMEVPHLKIASGQRAERLARGAGDLRRDDRFLDARADRRGMADAAGLDGHGAADIAAESA